MDEEYSSISYSGTPVRPDFLNEIIMVLGGMENEAESYGERRFVKVLINKAESLLENGYFNDQG